MSKQQDPKAQLAAGVHQTESTGSTQQVARGTPSARAWLAVATIDHEGRRCVVPEKGALTIIAVSVHEQCSVDVGERITLMHDVARCKQISPHIPSLWVFPAGYFGFNAAAYANKSTNAWWNLNPREIEEKLAKIVGPFPVGAWIAFGVDSSDGQEAWLVQRTQLNAEETLKLNKITRKASQDNQCVDLNRHGFKAAFFVCNEIAGYQGELSDCRLVVNLAHVRVPGTVSSADVGPRMVHQKALEAASFHGAALLAHHHAGDITNNGGTHFRHQSNWIMFHGDEPDWLDSAKVVELP